MTIEGILAARKPCFSFEFFPPQTDAAMEALLQTAASLRALDPAFVSVTYGAGGSTRRRTLEAVTSMKRDLGLEAMAHLTCVGADAQELRAILARICEAGIENVLALRGDPPRDQPQFQPSPGGLAHASDLVRLVRSEFGLCVGGACHPEKHLEAPDFYTDLRHLREKVESGARFLITQLFLDNEYYFSFVERARRAGIDVPIIPGIMPITNASQIARFTEMCGASIPARLLAELDARAGQPEAISDFGVAYATLQCVDLLARGVPAIHFYTLNKSPATRAVVSALLAARPWEPAGGRRYLPDNDAGLEAAFSLPQS
ncbi:MAG: methylenetetrahydrofolate reductase [NAD(P)H] [Candidatus Eremiobacteraeota bacterium]|nr:methylenetetrahydrofolate reductase [NAD(P)H] [Candidatus Eremiobacteraeota bacterium]MBC5826396.1 methylenetetrahydrofolate reductase [NAD(P)H] [Candidatus Eremiobacteraeota bacterium]